MKQGHNKNRNRGYHRGNNNRHRQNIPSKNQVIESTGPSGKIRGNLMQLVEKYLGAGKDAVAQDDIVLAESCYQYADHYTRLLNLVNAMENNRREEQHQQRNSENTETKPAEENLETTKSDTVMVKEEEKNTNQVADIAFLNNEIPVIEEEKEPSLQNKKRRVVRKKKIEPVKEVITDIPA